MNNSQMQEFIFQELGTNVNDLPTHWKRGVCIYSETREVPIEDVMPPSKYKELLEGGKVEVGQMVKRSFYEVDKQLPRFSADTDYIERFMNE